MTSHPQPPQWHGTTILTVRKGDTVVIGGDGQVSIGQTVIKSNARKVRPLGKGDVIGGFAGATADACARALLRAGAAQVDALVFARVVRETVRPI